MKKPVMILAAMIAAGIVAAVVVTQTSNWSNLSYEAVVQETVTMPDGELRLIVARTTEIHANPLNALQIGGETRILDTEGKPTSVEDLEPGVQVMVTLKDAFTEGTPFYYPTVYEIKLLAPPRSA